MTRELPLTQPERLDEAILTPREIAARERELIQLLISDYHYSREEAEAFVADFNRAGS